jgi:hypothetical protein
MLNTVKRTEWAFVAVVAIVVLVLTSLPYAFAYLSAPDDMTFMGFIFNASDHSQYMAWYRGFQTRFLISNRLTSEPNPPIFFNLLWFMLGRFGRYTGLSAPAVYQVFRWLAGGFFLFAVYGFTSEVLADLRQRRLAFLIVALGTGLGWVLVGVKYALGLDDVPFPLDVYISEGNSLLSMMAFPHFSEAAGLILAVFWLLLVGERRKQWRYGLYAGLVALFLGWQHGYDLLIVWGVPAAYIGLRIVLDGKLPSYWMKSVVTLGLLSWPPALYSLLLTRLDPLWNEILAQFSNAGVYSPNPLHMLILMGLPLMAALATLIAYSLACFRKGEDITTSRRSQELFVVAWFISGWLLIYVPTNFQVHMINSWQVPVALVATWGLHRYVVPVVRRNWPSLDATRWVIVVSVLLVIPTNLYLWLWRFYDLNRHDYPYYLHRDDVAALEWLDHHAPPDVLVLSAYDTGRYVPLLAESRAFLGHWAQTVDFYQKRSTVEAFFDADVSNAFRREVLSTYDVDYVLHGPAERALGDFAPDRASFLESVYTTPDVSLYAVTSGS